MKLTKATVAKLVIPDGKTELLVFDGALAGFGIRLREGGAARWIVQYRANNLQRRFTFGDLASLDATQARIEAGRLLSRIRLGEDPQGDKIASRQARSASAPMTLAYAATLFLAGAAFREMKSTSAADTRRYLEQHWRPLHGRLLTELTRRDVAERVAEIGRERGGVSANRARSALSGMFAWCIEQGLADVNPVLGSGRAVVERPRERILSDAEIRLLWQATAGGGDYHNIVRLLLLTGQRRDEVGALQRGELDLPGRLWRLPAARAKNGRDHTIPLSEPAAIMLAARPMWNDREALFGAGPRGYQGWSKSKVRLDADIAEIAGQPLRPWTIHDLRRTASTGMAELGVAPHVIESALNHVSGSRSSVSRVYNLSKYLTEKRAALELWADHVLALVSEAERVPELAS